MTNSKITWDKHFSLPEPGNMLTSTPNGRELFVKQGSRMSEKIIGHISEYFGGIHPSLKILDFGCGNGRVAMPFFYKHEKPTHCVDVDEKVVEFIKSTMPSIDASKTSYEPPLHFEDNTFDCVYAISVWTHLPENLQLLWLEEIKRIIKPGGLALISTSGYRALKSRRIKNLPGWDQVEDEDLVEKGFIFLDSNPARGITGTYGYAAHDPVWLKQTWGKVFDVRKTLIEEIEGVQDLNILVVPD